MNYLLLRDLFMQNKINFSIPDISTLQEYPERSEIITNNLHEAHKNTELNNLKRQAKDNAGIASYECL
jgi:CBS-domain-containing membrane protein